MLSILVRCAIVGVVGKRAQHPRLERFTLVLTDAERRTLATMAAATGVTMSELVRTRVFCKAVHDLPGERSQTDDERPVRVPLKHRHERKVGAHKPCTSTGYQSQSSGSLESGLYAACPATLRRTVRRRSRESAAEKASS